MISPVETTSGISLAVIPYWSQGSWICRFSVFVKVARDVTLEDTSAVALHLRDEAGREMDLHPRLHADVRRMVGPSWQKLKSESVTGAVVHSAEAVLPGVAQSPMMRREQRSQVIELVAMTTQVGVRGEPHLWWRFHNLGAQPIPSLEVLRNHRLWLDGVPYLAPIRQYDGPDLLQPSLLRTGVWSLDDFAAPRSSGNHRVELEICGVRSVPLDVTWRNLSE